MKYLTVFFFLFSIRQTYGAVTSANATAYVLRAISVQKVSDLNFGAGVPGDSEKIVVAGSSETLENASFKITGEPGAHFSVSFPQAEVFMNTGSGSTLQTQIKVSEFKANSDFQLNKLDNNGEFKLFVGAKRASLRVDQVPGPYIGHFNVVVVY